MVPFQNYSAAGSLLFSLPGTTNATRDEDSAFSAVVRLTNRYHGGLTRPRSGHVSPPEWLVVASLSSCDLFLPLI